MRASWVAVMRRCFQRVAACGLGYDQGTFTEIVYQSTETLSAHSPSSVKVSLFTAEHGPVLHGSLSRDLQINVAGEVLNEYGYPYAIVHQYDRFDRIHAHVKMRFPLENKAV